MTKKITFFLFLLISANAIHSQFRFEIGGEGGPTSDYYKIVDPENNLQTVPCISGFGGLVVRLNSKKKSFFEFGVLAQENWIGLKLSQQIGTLTSNHYQTWFFPLRFGYPIPLMKKLSFTPNAGITPVIKSSNEDGSLTRSTEVNSSGTFKYEYTSRPMHKDFYMLVNGGAALEWKFWRQLKLAGGINYYQGISTVSIADVKYQVNFGPEKYGELQGKGSFLAYTFGLRYLLK